MLSHNQIWEALDRLAERHELTPSGLARRAGLDPTSFNKSKRLSADGRLRWPSTESIAKVLDATGASMEQFLAFMRPDGAFGRQEGAFPQRGNSIPLLGFAQAGAGGFFDDGGFPAGGAGTWWNFRQPRHRNQASMRWRCRARACCRSTATATC